jgi:hypothetical protein
LRHDVKHSITADANTQPILIKFFIGYLVFNRYFQKKQSMQFTIFYLNNQKLFCESEDLPHKTKTRKPLNTSDLRAL